MVAPQGRVARCDRAQRAGARAFLPQPRRDRRASVLRVLYEEKRLEVTLARETAVRQSELQSRYKDLSGRLLNKTRFVDMLRRFRSRKLIALAGEETDPEALIILYPSIAFVLDGESIDDIYGRLEKLGEQEVPESASEEDEIADNPEPPIEEGGA